MKVAVIIPARYGSTRFPGKPLANVSGRPLISWVYERARAIPGVDYLAVATDDDRIADVVRTIGGNVIVTGACETGTDRVAAAAETLDADVIVNLQGDEPVFDPDIVTRMVAMLAAGDFGMTTAAHPIETDAERTSPHVVKVFVDGDVRALRFSREAPGDTSDAGTAPLRHIGIYAYRRDVLFRFTSLAPTESEKRERLEQLRALDNDIAIGVVVTDKGTLGVDVPDDVKSVEKAIARLYTG